ncbi:MAG TPA: MFS transporter [Gaiellaceae bacterium]|nr:MFS transporter [Gaiellaceae bacterium]
MTELAASPPRLPIRAKVLYASSSLGGEALTQSRGLWLLYYYAPPKDAELEQLLPLGLVGVLLTAGRLIESVDDALIGYWSDRTRSRLGRRLPFVLAATPPSALFAFLVFTPPPNAGTAVTAVYLFVTLELFFLFSTLSGGPYEALLPEIARTSRDRVDIVGIRVYFGAAGGAVGLIGSDLLIDRFGFRAMALVMAALALAFRYLGMIGVWRHASRTQPPVVLSLRESLGVTFSNVSFLVFLPTFVLFQISLQMLLGVLPYYVDAVLEERGTWVGKVHVLAAVALGSAVAAVPLFTLVARRRSKREAYSLAMLASALVFPIFAFAGFVPGIPLEVQVLIVMAVVGAPLAGVYLFPATLTADIVDDDGLRTGMRREATFYGAQNFVEKTATSLAPLFLAGLLTLGNTAEDPLGIRLVGPAAAVLVGIAYLAFRSYRLPDEVLPPVPASALANDPAARA